MRSLFRLSWILLPLIPVSTGCVDSTEVGGGPNAIHLRSDQGDWVGSGKSYDYTQANAVIDIGMSGIPATLTVGVVGDESWNGFFTMPAGVTRVSPGTYTQGLDWHGGYGAYACRTVTGSFTIERVSYDSTGVTAADLSFAQHCDSATAALHGTIHWRADDLTRPPEPVNPPPAELWRPPSGAIPAGVNSVYLQSDSGDVVGQGRTYLYTPANTTIDLSGAGGEISFTVADSQPWRGVFWKMGSIPRFAVGYYPGLQSVVLANPTKGALSVSGPEGCGVLNGWFAIDHITFVGDFVTAIDLRFEQHCSGGVPALRGAVHWTQ